MDFGSKSQRQQSIKFKLLPDGHIRAYSTLRSDLPGLSELMIYPPHIVAPTVTTSNHTNILIADEAIYNALSNATKAMRVSLSRSADKDTHK
jgi:hypothetical protein